MINDGDEQDYDSFEDDRGDSRGPIRKNRGRYDDENRMQGDRRRSRYGDRDQFAREHDNQEDQAWENNNRKRGHPRHFDRDPPHRDDNRDHRRGRRDRHTYEDSEDEESRQRERRESSKRLVQPINARLEDNRPKRYRDLDKMPQSYDDGVDEVSITYKHYSSKDRSLDSHVFGNIGLKDVDFRSPEVR